MNKFWLALFVAVLPLLGWSVVVEGRVPDPTARTIRVKGSDTMAVISSRWATRYQAETSGVTVDVAAGGSGNGISALINGHVEIATASRPLKSHEVRQIVSRSGKQPVLFLVGLDAISVVVHPLNPVLGLSVRQLADIYGREGSIKRWSDLGVVVPGCEDREIVRISRKNNSGTYYLFRQDLFHANAHFQTNMDYVASSEAVVQQVAQTPCAIGYVGMGFVTAAVKTLCITNKKGGSCVPPTVASVLEKRYPLARDLYMVTLGPPAELVKDYLQWILGPVGQEIVKKSGFIPVPKSAQRPF
ncbi:MAG: phosphate ABC transporter substrate-binding protein [Magnetococcales bacterium]|nr:phosphate ABC transporter substrate-binding protein [Magnetococcales bacterium]